MLLSTRFKTAAARNFLGKIMIKEFIRNGDSIILVPLPPVIRDRFVELGNLDSFHYLVVKLFRKDRKKRQDL